MTGKEEIIELDDRLFARTCDQLGVSLNDPVLAKVLDRNDPLAHFRSQFAIPKMEDQKDVDSRLLEDDEANVVYLCGHSLGLQPLKTSSLIDVELKKWKTIAIEGHFTGRLPWAECDELLVQSNARLIGAVEDEVAVMNGLSVNLHLLLISFYRPSGERNKILIESKAFPSDHYAVESQIRLHGLDPKECMIFLEPPQSEVLIDDAQILSTIAKHASEIALILLPGVQYFTGQLFDIQAVSKFARGHGCCIGWDLAHAVGNVPLSMHDWGADFAVWCTYKYLNSGPGCLAGAFVHTRHHSADLPKLHGWWSHKLSSRFKMNNCMDAAPGAFSYRISNPPPLLCAAMLASMDIFDATTSGERRRKSILLFTFLDRLLEPLIKDGRLVVLTPREVSRRGCQVSLRFLQENVREVYVGLQARGVMCDVREPNILRLSAIPLYNSFEDIQRFVSKLKHVLSLS